MDSALRLRGRARPLREAQKACRLPELLKRSHDADYMAEFGGAPMPIDEQTDADIVALHALRNQFTHFAPVGWSIELTGLPRLIAVAIRYAHRLLFGHPACTYRMDQNRSEIFVTRFREMNGSNGRRATGSFGSAVSASPYV